MPLRPELYRRLKAKFRHVEIANAGQEMLFRYQNGEFTKLKEGENYRVNCPFCNDTRKRLYISYMWGMPDEITGRPLLWLMGCFNENCFKRYPERRKALYEEIFDPTECSDAVNEIESGIVDDTPSRPAFLPGLITPINQLPADHAATVYLKSRGFDLDQLHTFFNVGYCQNSLPEVAMAASRIFIPIIEKGIFVGWQGRVIGEPPHKFIPKYYSMPGWRKSMFVYNRDLAARFNHVVICEGPTDVWRYGPEAVCLFGKMPSNMQAIIVNENWQYQFLMLDSDVSETEIAEAEKRLDYQVNPNNPPKRIKVQLPPGHDPGSMDPGYVRALVEAAAKREGIVLGQR